MKQCTCYAIKAINCICNQREDENSFAYWFYTAPHRIKYTRDHPAYLAAEEAWKAAHEVCAKICENYGDEAFVDGRINADHHAYLIRARGQA